MNHRDPNKHFEERLFELALLERVGGNTPPDLRAQTLEQLDDEDASHIETSAPRPLLWLKRHSPALAIASAAVIVLTLGLLVILQEKHHQPTPQIAEETNPTSDDLLSTTDDGTSISSLSPSFVPLLGSSWEEHEHNTKLDQGWFMLLPGAPKLSVIGHSIVNIDAEMLIYVGDESPTEERLEHITAELDALGYTEQSSAIMLAAGTLKWRHTLGVSFALLSGSAVFNSNVLYAESYSLCQTHCGLNKSRDQIKRSKQALMLSAHTCQSKALELLDQARVSGDRKYESKLRLQAKQLFAHAEFCLTQVAHLDKLLRKHLPPNKKPESHGPR